MPKISIVLPTYNVEKYISRALNSCIKQTLSDIEIIVVDDCGNDKSIEIAKEFASRDERIKIIKNPQNLKLLHARANGVKHSNADYIMFLDPDDELELNACEVAYGAMIEEKECDLVVFNHLRVFFDKEYSPRFLRVGFMDIQEFGKRWGEYDWSVCFRLYKKENYLKTMNFIDKYKNHITMGEDYLFSYFMLENCKNIKVIPNVLYKYYQTRDDSATTTQDIKKVYKNLADVVLCIKMMQENIKYDFQKEIVDKSYGLLAYFMRNLKYLNKDIKNLLKADFISKKDRFYVLNRFYRFKLRGGDESFANFLLFRYYDLRFKMEKKKLQKYSKSSQNN